MIRFGQLESLFFPGLDTDDPVELKRDKSKPSWLPRGHVFMQVRRVWRRQNFRNNRWNPTGYFVISDPGHLLNLKLSGEILMPSRPHSSKARQAPVTLDTLLMTADHIDQSWQGYASWLESDMGFVVATAEQLKRWKRLPDFQKRMIHAEIQRRGKHYRRSLTTDRQRVKGMLENGVKDVLDRDNPSATVLQLRGSQRALGRQAANDGISRLANVGRQAVAGDIYDHQMAVLKLLYESGDLKWARSLVVKMPSYGANWLHHQSQVTPEQVQQVVGFELYFSVLYRQLSAVGRGELDPAELSVPPVDLDFSKIDAYRDLSEILMGRIEDLFTGFDSLTSGIVKQQTKTIQGLMRYRLDSPVWSAPDLTHYLSVL